MRRGWERLARRAPPMKGSCAGACSSCCRSPRWCRRVIVGVLAILRARHDVEDEVERGALALIRALGAALDGTLQDARRTVELAASRRGPTRPAMRARRQLLARAAAPRGADRADAVASSIPTASSLDGDPVPAGRRHRLAQLRRLHRRRGVRRRAADRPPRRPGARPHRRADRRRRRRARPRLRPRRDRGGAPRTGRARARRRRRAACPVATSEPGVAVAERRSPGAIPSSIARSRRRSRARCRRGGMVERVPQPVELPVAARRAVGDHPPAARGRRPTRSRAARRATR